MSDGNDHTCKACGAPILWCVSEKGQRMPLSMKSLERRFIVQPMKSGGGNDYLVAKMAETYISHFADCPNADEFQEKEVTRFKLKPNEPYEKDHQAAVIDWANKLGIHQYPDLKMLFAIPNGAQYGGTNRYKEAGRMRMLGLRKGVPDLFLPVPRRRAESVNLGLLAIDMWYGGLWIEMKRNAKASLSPDQEWWIAELKAQGHAAVVCTSASEAIEIICHYLEGLPL